ncbi:MAG: DUF3078 domain-containing protein [Saprospiraceae bacterium]|nr:MAG: hypothetical protein UZ09_BCD002001118 [Bacteroidetes bacterium OLB9]MCO6464479.1 DUF3078 domain-containing protein [Saprospiraceae bacterium]MCZ2339979.1 DUF3078 domain-containing protein [Chitinophagales bacterium]
MKNIVTFIMIMLSASIISAQSLDELKAEKAKLEEKAAPMIKEVDAIKAEIDALNKKIAAFPGWYKGASGIIGANFLGRNRWFAAGDLSDSKATNLSGTFTGFLNRLDENYFWRNSAGLNLGWQKLKTGTEATEPKFEPVADVFNVSSLFGYNITKKLAASALGEYRTTVIKNFNDPGYLDLGLGFTYTPMKNMVLVFHPINYNFIFAKAGSNFTPSLGCKIVGDYTTEIIKGVNWRSNLTGFLSYKKSSPSLHNGTWTNWIGFNVWKGIGVGAELGLRYSEQEINKLQNYYTIGLSYKL